MHRRPSPPSPGARLVPVPLVAPPSARERRLFVGGVGLLAALGLALYERYPTYPAYDSLTALSWGRDLLDGRLPAFDAFRAPTQHPLLLAVGVVLEPFGFAKAAFVPGLARRARCRTLSHLYRHRRRETPRPTTPRCRPAALAHRSTRTARHRPAAAPPLRAPRSTSPRRARR